MRTIDADALIKSLNEAQVEFSEPVCPGCRARMKIGGDNT